MKLNHNLTMKNANIREQLNIQNTKHTYKTDDIHTVKSNAQQQNKGLPSYIIVDESLISKMTLASQLS